MTVEHQPNPKDKNIEKKLQNLLDTYISAGKSPDEILNEMSEFVQSQKTIKDRLTEMLDQAGSDENKTNVLKKISQFVQNQQQTKQGNSTEEISQDRTPPPPSYRQRHPADLEGYGFKWTPSDCGNSGCGG